MTMNVFLRDLPFRPGTLLLRVPWGSSAGAILAQLGACLSPVGRPLIDLYHDGHRVSFDTPFFDRDVYLRARVHRALPGGKGGFGATLRGTASARASANTDACRDLQGRRLGDVRREQAARKRARERKEEEDDPIPAPAAPEQAPEEEQPTPIIVDDVEETLRAHSVEDDDDFAVAGLSIKRRRVK